MPRTHPPYAPEYRRRIIHLRGCHDVPGTGCLHQRLRCVAPAAAISTGARRRGTHFAYQRDSSYSRATYGAPRIDEELLAVGIHVGRKRVARLMKAADLCGVSRRQWITTTVREPKRAAGNRPGRTQLHRRGAQSVVSRRYHLHPDLGWLSIPGGGARYFQPQKRRLGDGNPPEHGTGAASAQPGAVAASARRRRDSSFGPG